MAGLFNGIIAPLIFKDAYEYPLILILTLTYINLRPKRYDWICPVFILIILIIDYFARVIEGYHYIANYPLISLALLVSLFIWQPRRLHMITSLLLISIFTLVIPNQINTVLAQQRNFFGVKKIVKFGNMHVLFNHTTIHGLQVLTLKEQNGKQSYYGSISKLIDKYHQWYGTLKATIIGMGTGMMTCQFHNDDQLTLIDIDPQVVAIAQNSHYFTFLRDCGKKANIILGDGRLTVDKLKKHSQNIIILDAFTSDAIPIHLLTLEAIQHYQTALATDGILLIHISNRHINLLPVLTTSGRLLNLIVLHQKHPADLQRYQLSSEWVILTRNEAFAQSMLQDPYWRFVISPSWLLWKDNFASIISVLK